MPRYLLSVHVRNAAPRPPSEEDMRESMARIGELEREMQAANALVFSGRLDEPGAAAVVRADGDETITTDGPYAESKELIGGFYIVDAPDRDAALRWAARTTAAVGMPIEVWPFLDSRDG